MNDTTAESKDDIITTALDTLAAAMARGLVDAGRDLAIVDIPEACAAGQFLLAYRDARDRRDGVKRILEGKG